MPGHVRRGASRRRRPERRFTSYQWQPRDCQFYLEAVNEPAALWKQWIAQYRTQTALVLFLVFLQWALLKLETFLDRIGRLRGRKLSAKQQLMVDMSRSIAKSYNVGGDEVGTGVDFEDVQVRRSPHCCCLISAVVVALAVAPQ